MRPKDLIFEHQLLQEKVPFFQKDILYVPNYPKTPAKNLLQEYWAWLNSFDKIAIEFCTGNGDWIIQKAKMQPEIGWLAVEKKFTRVRKIWSKSHNYKLKNLSIVYGCGEIFAESYMPLKKVSDVYINFPDPWPKRRHEKNRLVKADFLAYLEPLMISSGRLFFITDFLPYLQSVIALFLQAPLRWKAQWPDPFYRKDYYPEYGFSRFGELWQSKGRNIFCTYFQKT